MNGYVDHIFREQIVSNSILDRSNTKEKENRSKTRMVATDLSHEFDEDKSDE